MLTPEDVFVAARRFANNSFRLAFVPELVEELMRRGHRLADIKQALLDADRARFIELRPDSGIELLKPRQAELCPTGARGCRLSYLRVID